MVVPLASRKEIYSEIASIVSWPRYLVCSSYSCSILIFLLIVGWKIVYIVFVCFQPPTIVYGLFCK